MIKEIIVDCRELESPEPLNLVVSNLYKIEENSYIKMLHRMEPMILFNILNQNGYEYFVKQKEDEVEIYIFNNKKVKDYLKCSQV